MARLTSGTPTTRMPDRPARIRATEVAGQVDHWGFVAHPDLPEAPGPAFLLVALRPAPTLLHYDPEAVDYWVSDDGRGSGGRSPMTAHAPLGGRSPGA